MERVAVTPIIALDVSSLAGALRIVTDLGDACTYFKVGSELFASEGPHVIGALRERDKRVFLDLKFHDIPTTVGAASSAASRAGASLLTVHASGGEAMVRAAVAGAGGECQVLAVTVLTSLDASDLAELWGRPTTSVEHEVIRLARTASRGGAHGIVCSGSEVAAVRATFGSALAVLVPGIRFADGQRHDQRRVVTPREAALSGANYLVIGRAVTEAADPREAMKRVWDEIAGKREAGKGMREVVSGPAD